MDVAISSDLLARIVAEAAATPGVEVCGLLLGRIDPPVVRPAPPHPFALGLSKGVPQAPCPDHVLRQARHERAGEERSPARYPRSTVEEVRPCRNVAADPSRTFEIDPAALIAAHRAARAGGPAILGCYHSHPSGVAEPSQRDAADAAANGWLWVIVAGDDVRVWRAVADGAVWGRFVAVGGNFGGRRTDRFQGAITAIAGFLEKGWLIGHKKAFPKLLQRWFWEGVVGQVHDHAEGDGKTFPSDRMSVSPVPVEERFCLASNPHLTICITIDVNASRAPEPCPLRGDVCLRHTARVEQPLTNGGVQAARHRVFD